MKRWLIRSVQVAALAMGGLALTGTAAHADSWNSGPNIGAFNGNQSSTTIQTPFNYCGNSIAIIGFASANCQGGAVAYNGSGGAFSGAGYSGNSNGGNNASTNGVHHKKHKKHKHSTANANSNDDNHYYSNGSGSGSGSGGAVAYNDNGNWSSGPNIGVGNGNQSSFTYQAPVNVSCNSFALVGFASSC
jgi:hypothetical protein